MVLLIRSKEQKCSAYSFKYNEDLKQIVQEELLRITQDLFSRAYNSFSIETVVFTLGSLNVDGFQSK